MATITLDTSEITTPGLVALITPSQLTSITRQAALANINLQSFVIETLAAPPTPPTPQEVWSSAMR